MSNAFTRLLQEETKQQQQLNSNEPQKQAVESKPVF
jgi:hypothetical protein